VEAFIASPRNDGTATTARAVRPAAPATYSGATADARLGHAGVIFHLDLAAIVEFLLGARPEVDPDNFNGPARPPLPDRLVARLRIDLSPR